MNHERHEHKVYDEDDDWKGRQTTREVEDRDENNHLYHGVANPSGTDQDVQRSLDIGGNSENLLESYGVGTGTDSPQLAGEYCQRYEESGEHGSDGQDQDVFNCC